MGRGGRIWITDHAAGSPSPYWTAFDADGAMLGRLELPSTVRASGHVTWVVDSFHADAIQFNPRPPSVGAGVRSSSGLSPELALRYSDVAFRHTAWRGDGRRIDFHTMLGTGAGEMPRGSLLSLQTGGTIGRSSRNRPQCASHGPPD